MFRNSIVGVIKMDLKSKLENISKLTHYEIGTSEENVKQKIVVPLLEILGHSRNDLDFEYGSQGKRIDIFIKGLPVDCKIVIDTKKYNENLSNHLEQIGLYAFQEGALLALIINGEELRIYDPFFRGYSIKDSLLFSIKRVDLASNESVRILKGLLLKENILNKSIKQTIVKREEEIQEANSIIESIKNEIMGQIDKIQNEIKELSLKEEEKGKIHSIKEQYKLNQETESKTQKIRPYEMQKYRTRNIFSKSSDKIEIVLNNLHTPKKYALIPLPKELRYLFPGFKVKFELETDIGLILTKVTSGPKGTEYGDPVVGNYIQGNLKRWYEAHPELKNGNTLIISVVEPKKRYSLTIR